MKIEDKDLKEIYELVEMAQIKNDNLFAEYSKSIGRLTKSPPNDIAEAFQKRLRMNLSGLKA
jgi:hypothetical protein